MFKIFPIINIATPLKNSAIGILRISFGLINKKFLYFFYKKFFCKILKPKVINFIYFYNLKNIILDKGLALYFPKPNSYTGEDLLEIQLHGNIFILNYILKICLLFLKKYSIKISERGWFTKKSFYNKKINFFELKKIFYLLKFKKLNILSNFNFFNFKILIIKLLKNLEKIQILNFKFLLSENINKNYILFILNKIKKISFLILKNFNYNKKKYIIILGETNTGKSTFLNCISKNNFSIISKISGTTRDILKKKIKINNFVFYLYDSPGFVNILKNNLEYLTLLFLLKKLKKYKFLFYFYDNLIFYNPFFYYIKKGVIKNQVIIKILNKIDFLKIYCSFEIYIKKLKFIKIKISSKLKSGFFYFFNELKRNYYKNFVNFNNFFFKIIKKSYKILLKIFIFFLNQKIFLFFKEIKKIKAILNILLKKKNKFLFNKIFNNFCLGK